MAATALPFFVDKPGSRFPVFFDMTVLPVRVLATCVWGSRANNVQLLTP